MSRLAAFLFILGVATACVYEKDARGLRTLGARAAHWTYEGDEGPSHWATLDSSYALCGSGKKQTPVNFELVGGTSSYGIGSLRWTAETVVASNVTNNGHTVVTNGSPANTVSGGPLFADKYELAQFHFHAPSEHTFNGVHYPLEVHFVHKHIETGDLAVVGVLFDIGLSENLWLKSLFEDLPEDGDTNTITLNPYDGLPSDKSYYHYQGSLTTPPCSEGVSWLVMKKVLSISEHQLELLEEVMHENSRPIQNINGRTVFSNAAAQPVPSDDGDNSDGDDNENPSSSGWANTIININFAGMIPDLN